MAGDFINSSDQEFSDLEVDKPFAHLGMSSIERMRENRLELRLESKKDLKKLEQLNVRRSPGVARNAALWENRFNAFYTEVLGKSRGQMPTPDDVLRFLTQLPKIIGPNRIYSRDAYGVGTFQDANFYIVDDILYKHASAQAIFRTANFAMKFRSLTQTHVNNGFLTRHSAREAKQWIGAHLLAKMCRALLLRSASHGTVSWDYRIQQALLLALMCGTAGRIGDILNSYTTGPQNLCLAWESIILKLKTEASGVETVVASITLKHTKNNKDNSENITHKFSPLPPEYASACIIRLLLVHALRMGVILGAPRSFEQVIRGMRQNRGKKIRWKNPMDPVLLGHKGSNSDYILIPGKPATTYLGNATVRYAADLVGLPVTLVCHDIRRGSARDVATLPSQELPQLNHEAARRILGHSHQSFRRGVTEKYVGDEIADNYTARVRNSENLRDYDAFALGASDGELVDRVFVPQRLTAAEVTRYCEEHGWSTTDHNSRNKAGRFIRRAQRAVWASEGGPSAAGSRDSDQDDSDYGMEPAPKRSRVDTTATPAATTRLSLRQREEASPSDDEDDEGYFEEDERQDGTDSFTGEMIDDFMASSVKIAQSQTDLGLIDADLLMMMDESDAVQDEQQQSEEGSDEEWQPESDAVQDEQQQSEQGSDEEWQPESAHEVPSSPSPPTTESKVAVGESKSYEVTSGDAAADKALSSNIRSASLGDFVESLSRVNLLTRPHPSRAARQYAQQLSTMTHAGYEAFLGYPTSKDVLKPTEFKCLFSASGCIKTSPRPNDMWVHVQSCHFAPAIDVLDCPEEDCDVKCSGEANLQAHLRRHKRKSTGYSVSCQEPDCNGGPYSTAQALRQHLHLSHGYPRAEATLKAAAWSASNPVDEDVEEEESTGSPAAAPPAVELVTGYPKPCPLPTICKSTHVHKHKDALRRHFRQVHNMTNAQAKIKEREFEDVPHAPVVYKPREANHLGYSMMCRIPKCKGRGKPMTFPGSVVKHLQDYHDMAYQQAKQTEQEWSKGSEAS